VVDEPKTREKRDKPKRVFRRTIGLNGLGYPPKGPSGQLPIPKKILSRKLMHRLPK